MSVDILNRDFSQNEEVHVYDYSSPNTPLSTPPDSVSIPMDSINFDLLDETDELFNSLARIPSFEQNRQIPHMLYNIESLYDTQFVTRPKMINPYFKLEMIACLILNIALSVNDFTFALVEFRGDAESDKLIRYIVPKAINMTTIGLVAFVFTNSETYKSINITIEYLLVNAIIYEYTLMNTLKYLIIQFALSVLGCFMTIGMYHNLIKDIPTKIILNVIFSSKRKYNLDFSYVLVSIMMHSILGLGVAILANLTTSTNSKTRAIQKATLIFFISISFGIVIGPIGTTFHDLILYSLCVIVKNDYSAINYQILIVYVASILSTFIIYPLVTIRYKYVWLNTYRRYIEYRMNK